MSMNFLIVFLFSMNFLAEIVFFGLGGSGYLAGSGYLEIS